MTPRGRLRLGLAAFFVALAVPGVALVVQALDRLQWEAFHQQQRQAEELAGRIDRDLHALVAREDARPVTEYAFLNVLGPGTADLLQRSPLAARPPENALPGLLGHFQIDNDGSFHVPFLPPPAVAPAAVGLTPEDVAMRQALAGRLQEILRRNRLLAVPLERPAPAAPPGVTAGAVAAANADTAADALVAAPPPAAPDAFERLERAASASSRAPMAPRMSESPATATLEKRYAEPAVALPPPAPSRPALRREQNALPEQAIAPASRVARLEPLRIRTFESEVDALSAAVLTGGELVLYRKVWREGQRLVQGLLLDPDTLLAARVGEPFATSTLAGSAVLAVAIRGEVQTVFRQDAPEYGVSEPLRGTLLYQTRLGAPLNEVELVFSVNTLPAGAGARVVGWLAVALGLVLCGGIALMYRLGLRQLALVEQQQDFVAAVSHELKTPLTAIRMYAEMLRAGWAPEDKRAGYYAFIHDESERLARLIHNVLSLSRLTRQSLRLQTERVTVAQVVDLLRSRVGSVLEQTGRPLRLDCPSALLGATLETDLDCLIQIVLNLVDNAIKFSAAAAEQAIDLRLAQPAARVLELSVRDYGPGIPAEQLGRIFEPFYRGESALTRSTGGTGIGLALVQRLAGALGGQIAVSNQQPGAMFSLRLPLE